MPDGSASWQWLIGGRSGRHFTLSCQPSTNQNKTRNKWGRNHALLMEGVELALKKRGYPALADIKESGSARNAEALLSGRGVPVRTDREEESEELIRSS